MSKKKSPTSNLQPNLRKLFYDPEAYIASFNALNFDPLIDSFEVQGPDAIEFFNTAGYIISQATNSGEIISFDPILDPLIYDTKPPSGKVNLPFESFFINKTFLIDNYIIPGIAILQLPEHNVITTCFFYINATNNPHSDTLDNGFFIGKTALGELFPSTFETEDHGFDVDEVRRTAGDLEKEILRYAVNAVNIINAPHPDIQIIHRKPSSRKTNPQLPTYNPHVRPTTHITLSGNLKRYVTAYNEARTSKKFTHSTLVRGHYRTLRSDFYKAKKGQTIWVPPFIRGDATEVLHKFLNVHKK